MINDAVSVKAQAEARYYLEGKQRQKDDRLLSWIIFLSIIGFSSTIIVVNVC